MPQIRAILRSSRVRIDVAVLVLLGVASAATWIPRLRGPIDLRWDGAAYYILGTSLARGSGYRLLSEPGEIESIQYPPLLPGLVAIYQLVLGTEDWTVIGVWLRITFFAIFILYIGAVYVLARAFLSPLYALTVAALTLLHYGTQFQSDLLFAELPFALVTMLFLVWARRDEHRISFRTSLAAITAYGLRTAGIALLAAWVGDAVLRRRFRTALARLVIAMFPILAWQGHVAAVQSSPAYRNPAYEYQRAPYLYSNVSYATNAFTFKDPFQPELGRATPGDIALRFARNLRAIPTALGEAVSSNRAAVRNSLTEILRLPMIPGTVTWLLFGLGCLVMAGSAIHLAGREWLMPLYAAFSVILMCLTPFADQFWRYLVPITPILSLWLVESLRWLARFPRSRRLRPVPVTGVAIGLLLVLQAYMLVRVYRHFHLDATYIDHRGIQAHYRLFYYYPSYRAQDEALDWLKNHAGVGDVLAAPDPHWAYIRTGRKAVFPPFELEAPEAERLLGTIPVRYLIIQNGAARAFDRYETPVIESDPNGWRRVALDIDSRVMVYERTRSDRREQQ
jgi:hypothetical protein